jgi:ribosomal protein S18 acetylase RimI-like enzyme
MQALSIIHDQILAFTQRSPFSCFHAIDMPYRLCSPAAQEPANCRLWHDRSGAVRGFGVVQLPFSTLDWAVRPGDESLRQEIVAWGVARLQEIARQRGERFGYLLDSRSNNDPVALAAGFEVDDWHIRNLMLEFSQPPTPPTIPSSFRIRPLSGQQEVAAYVDLHRAAFQTRNMSVEWRAKTLAHPLYQPDLDLVVEATDGQLVAFCIGWLGGSDGPLTGQIEPLGVLPAYHRQGLGRAILLESLQRFYKMGATRVLIDAENNNEASQHLYEGNGFREVAKSYKYFRLF